MGASMRGMRQYTRHKTEEADKRQYTRHKAREGTRDWMHKRAGMKCRETQAARIKGTRETS